MGGVVERELLEVDSPLRRRVRRPVGPHPARSLAVRATAIGAAAMAVGWYLGPEDGLVPLLVLAGLGAVLGIRWARIVWDRRTVGRRIRRVTGEQPVSLGSWRVGGSGYWLRSVPGAAAPEATPGPPLIGIGLSRQGSDLLWGPHAAPPPRAPAQPPAPGALWGPGVGWSQPPSARPVPAGIRPITPSDPAGGPIVPWAPPRSPERVPWIPPGGSTPPVATVPPVPATAPWTPPLAGTAPAPAWSVPGAYGWRRATSGIGPYGSGEEVEVLLTAEEIWVSGRLVERYARVGSVIEPIAEDGLAITAGDAAIRRWITLVPEDPRDLVWVLELLRPDGDGLGDETTAELEDDVPPIAEPPTEPQDGHPERERWDDPRAAIDDGR